MLLDPGPADRLSIDGVDQHQVNRRVIDLHEVKRVAGRRCMAMHRLCFGALLTAVSQVSNGQRLEAAPDRAG
jgi:hypothetical protein